MKQQKISAQAPQILYKTNDFRPKNKLVIISQNATLQIMEIKIISPN